MKFQFLSAEIRGQLQSPQAAQLLISVPEFLEPVMRELGNQIRALDFSPADSSDRSVGYLDRCFSEICGLVDWAAAIHRKISDSELSTEELVTNARAGVVGSPREIFIGGVELWHEFDEIDESCYVSTVRYPHSHPCEIRKATIGNVCAALGLAVLDRLLVRLPKLPKEVALAELGVAWQCAAIAGRHNLHTTLVHLYDLRSAVKTDQPGTDAT